MNTDIAFPRRGFVEITLITLLTCGIGSLYIAYSQYKALKQLNPEALDPALALILQIVGYLVTGGLLSLGVEYVQTKRLVDVGARMNDPRRNYNLMLIVMGAHVASLFSLWFSWTGFLAILALVFSIFATFQVQKELELYTRA